jgi:hypothetical protein
VSNCEIKHGFFLSTPAGKSYAGAAAVLVDEFDASAL